MDDNVVRTPRECEDRLHAPEASNKLPSGQDRHGHVHERTLLADRLSLPTQLVEFFFFFSSRRRHTRFDCDWSSVLFRSDVIHLAIVGDTAGNPTTQMVVAPSSDQTTVITDELERLLLSGPLAPLVAGVVHAPFFEVT